MVDDKRLSEIVNESGFPLQIGIANLVGKSNSCWTVLYSEHSWENDQEDTKGFLDLALQNSHGTSVLVIE